jgi:phosphonate transport system substrate-binding protein
MPVVVLRSATHEELFDALRRGGLDAAWVSPIACVRAQAERLARPRVSLARGESSTLVAVLVARAVAQLRLDAASLSGKRVAWVDGWSAAGYLAPRRMLRELGIEPARTFSAQLAIGSFEGVLGCVLAGTADVGAVYGWFDADDRLRFLGDEREDLVVLATTDPIPGDVLVFREGFPRAMEDAIVQGFLDADRADPEVAPLLEAAAAERFVRYDPDGYEDIARALESDRTAADGGGVKELLGAPIDDLDWE